MRGRPVEPGRRVRLEPDAELRRLMRSWRERLDPARIPGYDRGGRQVTQEAVAQLVGASQLWYGRLERGELESSYSAEFLDRVAYALQLDNDERDVLYHLARGRPPAPRVRPSTEAVNDAVKSLVNIVPWPSWISDRAWDVIVFNTAMLEWFPHMSFETNIMRWVFYYPQSQLQLVDWHTTWAPLMLAQMRAAHARWPDNERLNALIEETLTVNEYASALWDKDPRVYVHPDGDRRRLRVPGQDAVQWVEIVALSPMRADDLRMIVLVPVDEGGT